MSERDIFLAATEMTDPVARSAYLDGACGGDTGLRMRVEALLRAHDLPDSLLDHVVVPAPRPACPTTVAKGHEGGAATEGEVPLGFLAPATRPDSRGRIGHYEVLQLLGQGGFGIVFRAFDDVLHRVVAVKVLSPQIAATSPARKRFLREARSSAAVRHENVVQVHEVGEQPLPYLVMEFIPGETLQQRLDRIGPVEVSEVVRIGRQIAEGLAAAHATDLIHRDIKPGNILLEGAQLRVKITDFGLARAADDASISQSGIIAGTPMYMAPEQALGHTLDQRADLFSLGSVLYQMAAGRPPFRANSMVAVLKRVAEDMPRDIREIIPETPQWLCNIIAKLHAKNPDDRYQSAREVADVLADFEAQLKANSKLKDFSRIPRGKSSSPGRRKWVAAAAALLLPVIALAATEFAGITHLLRNQEPTVVVTPNVDPEVTPKGGPKADPKTTPATGRFALAFDGEKSLVRIPSLRITEDHPLTVEAWAELEQPVDQPKKYDLIGNQDLGGFCLNVAKGDGGDGKRLAFMIRLKNPETYVAAWEKQPVPRHQLTHLAGVYDGKAEIRFYVNGQLQSRTPARGIKPSAMHLTLGSNHDAVTNMFLGRMNEVRISKLARYDTDFTPVQRWEPDTDTLALYHFDKGEGIVLKDSSGNGQHGEIVGATWVKADGSLLPRSVADSRSGWHGWPADAPNPAIAPFDATQARRHQEAWAKHLGVPVEFANSIGMKFMLIPPGEFMMGSADDDTAARPNEKPRHKVELTRPMLMGLHEVTVGQFRAFVEATGYKTEAYTSRKGSNYWNDARRIYIQRPDITWARPPFEQADDHPVCCVTWNDAEKFCEWLSRRDGRAYVLPTEAQWEFACRAGSTTQAPFGDNFDGTKANVRATGLGRTCTVGSYAPNAFGLFDMIGNVYEWCQDDLRSCGPGTAIDPTGPLDAAKSTRRGGAYGSDPTFFRSASRAAYPSGVAYAGNGFRVVIVGDLR